MNNNHNTVAMETRAPIYSHPDGHTITFDGHYLTIEQSADGDVIHTASTPRGPKGLKDLAQALMALASLVKVGAIR